MTGKISKTIAAIIMTVLLLTGAAPSFADTDVTTESNEPNLTATSALLMDAGTGEILYEKNATERRDPASITKILNYLVVRDTLDMDDEVTCVSGLEPLGHVINLKEGEVIKVRDLVNAMLVYSANDAAEMLAIASGGSVKEFSNMMNEKARELGCESTNYTNANGMNNYGQEHHKTTARDLAIMTREALKDKQFRKIVTKVDYTIPATNKKSERHIYSTNMLLYMDDEFKFENPYVQEGSENEEEELVPTRVEINGKKVPFKYEGCTGVKTGYTGASGYCFIGSAKRGNTELIAVILNAREEYDRYGEAIELLDYGFENFKTITMAKAKTYEKTYKVYAGKKREIKCGIEENLNLTVGRDVEKESLKKEINITADTHEGKLAAPVNKGDVVGQIQIVNDKGQVLKTANLVALDECLEGGPLSRYGIADEDLPYVAAAAGTLLLIIIISIVLIVKRRKKKQEENV